MRGLRALAGEGLLAVGLTIVLSLGLTVVAPSVATGQSGYPPLTITSTSLPNCTVGSSYSATLTATGGVPPYTWSITSGSLPPVLSLNASTGAITGTCTTVGTFNFTAMVTDSFAGATTASQPLSITVTAAATTTTTAPVTGPAAAAPAPTAVPTPVTVTG